MPVTVIRLFAVFWMLAAWATAAGAAAPANRVISLTPHITELIYAAGGGDKLIATVSSSDYPPAARTLPRIGDGLSINTENLLVMNPDLVVAWHARGAALALAPTLERLSITLAYANPKTLAEIPLAIRRLGDLMGTEQAAQASAQSLDQRLTALRERYAQRAPVRVFIEIGTNPLYTIGNDPLLNDVLHICGGVNIYADSSLAAPLVGTEGVLARQPEVIIMGGTDPSALALRQQAWTTLHLKAAIQHHIYAIDPDALFRPGPRLIDAAEALCGYLDQARTSQP